MGLLPLPEVGFALSVVDSVTNEIEKEEDRGLNSLFLKGLTDPGLLSPSQNKGTELNETPPLPTNWSDCLILQDLNETRKINLKTEGDGSSIKILNPNFNPEDKESAKIEAKTLRPKQPTRVHLSDFFPFLNVANGSAPSTSTDVARTPSIAAACGQVTVQYLPILVFVSRDHPLSIKIPSGR